METLNANPARDIIIAIVSYLAGVATFFFQELIREKFLRGNIKWTEKRNLAKYVMRKLAEGQHDNYKTKITSKQQLNAFNVSDEIEAYDYKLASEFRTFIGLWAFLYLYKNIETHKKDYLELITKADSAAVSIREQVKKWIR